MKQHFFILIALIATIAIIVISCNKESNISGKISYNTHIRPILSDKCFKCHGPDENKRISGYRLDTPEGAFALLKDKVNKYGIVKGHPEKSDLYLRITSIDPEYMMPPPESNLKLNAHEISIIQQWIKQGADYEKHWSFLPIKKSVLPNVSDKKWPINELDYFTLAKMDEQNLSPSKEESKEKLLKRVYHDLIGLPPSPKEINDFINDKSNNAYDKVVDKLLANQHYGEKMSVFWLDIARYADSHGYQDDGLRTMWPWRDWVIHAFNQNYDYKKFITWQLAGDLLPEKNKETILATGFNRNHKITQEGGVIDEEYRVEYVADRTNTFSKGLLAMTYECAKCHDHKYDPISQKDYYSTFAFFNQVNEKGLYGDISINSLADPPYMEITKEDRAGLLNFISNLDTNKVKVMIMKDSIIKRTTYVLDRGVYDRHKDSVECNTPKAILKFDTNKFEKNRYGLSKWLFDDSNPLTARVFTNLMWQEFFGRGIVKTAGDFGLQGELPSHPELLDYMAFDFKNSGWDIKKLVKKIVTSATYKQSSSTTKESLAIDPENIYLSHGPRVKLSAELLKDHVLASSGLLNKTIGGPSIKPYQPKGLWEAATSGRGELAVYKQDHGAKLYRRGMYTFIKRTVPPPSMLILDASNRDQCEVRRSKTNTPLQSLVMLNDVQILEASRYLAQNLVKEKSSYDDKISKAFKSIVCRNPKSEELDKITKYYTELSKKINAVKAKKILAIGEYEAAKDNLVETAAMMQTIHLLYNLEETSMR